MFKPNSKIYICKECSFTIHTKAENCPVCGSKQWRKEETYVIKPSGSSVTKEIS